MSKMSRRAFLSSAGAVTGAAALGAATAGSSIVHVAELAALPATAKGPVVAYVRDVNRGEVAVMAGDHEVTVRDHTLARRIVAAASS